MFFHRYNKLIWVVILGGWLVAKPALAFCPVCTVAVLGGLGLSRYLRIDDTVSGLWLGAVTVALAIWTINWLKQKNWVFKGLPVVTVIFYYALLIVPLYYYGIIGHPLNKLWGVDKLLLGVVIGSISFFGFGRLYFYLKKKNNGRAHFPLEKVVLPVGALIIWSIIFYFLTR